VDPIICIVNDSPDTWICSIGQEKKILQFAVITGACLFELGATIATAGLTATALIAASTNDNTG
jgi:hypothetical protein